MDIATIDRVEAAQEFLRSAKLPFVSISLDQHSFVASTYWPNGDLIRDRHCCGHGTTLLDALAGMNAQIEIAKIAGKPLMTAAECKAAVLDLIREHDAAPASFRDAVDALPVQS